MILDTPLLPLDFWRQEIGYHPWHFWGLADSTIVPVTSKCNDVVREYSWQGVDESGRSDIRQAIMDAERLFFERARFWPAPVYSTDTLLWPKYFNPRLSRTNQVDVRNRFVPVQLREGYVQDLGIELFSLIDNNAALTFSDEDGDGLDDTFTASVVTSVTDPDEISIYFKITDRLDYDDEISSRWRIEPVHVSISAGTATIKGKSWLVVLPTLYEDKNNYPIDPTISGNFISAVEVYRRFTYKDGQVSTSDSQAALIWESRPCSWGCSSPASSTDPNAEGWVAGRSGIRDSQDGIVIPAQAVYNQTTDLWSHPCNCTDSCGEPDKVLIRYLAGYPLDRHGWMQKFMRTIISRFAAAEMTRRICACDQANREWSNWQFDISRVNAPEEYQANVDSLSNPLGTRRGHIFAWQQIKQLSRTVGIIS